jgi:hypothetical protein
MTNKEINRKIQDLLGNENNYEIRREFRVVESELTKEQALAIFNDLADQHLYSVTTSVPPNYSEDMEMALYAAKRIAEKNKETFVLSLEDGTWKAAYGDWGNCAEYKGGNPAYATCLCILQFMGKA